MTPAGLALTACGVVVVLAVLAVALPSCRFRRELARWETAFGPVAALGRTESTPELDGRTQRLADLSAQLGVPLEPRRPFGPPTLVEWPGLDQPLSTWVRDEAGRRTDESKAPPLEIEALLRDLDSGLQLLEDHLLETGSPSWPALHNEGSPHGTTVDARALLRLRMLLVARCLDATRRGDEAAALRTAEASWVLGQASEGHPALALGHVEGFRYLLGALRKIQRPPPEWSARIAAVDPLRTFRESVLAEGAFAHALVTDETEWWLVQPMLEGSQARSERTLAKLPQPLRAISLRLLAAQLLETNRRAVTAVDALPHCSMRELDAEVHGALDAESNVPMALSVSDEHTASQLRLPFIEARLDAMLTARVIGVRSGALDAVPGIRHEADWTSPNCPEAVWRVETSADGAVTIAVEYPDGRCARGGFQAPPCRFTIARPRGGQ